eukprot:scaffold100364_cov45-Prasinocladus_malaysianus.AAC.1
MHFSVTGHAAECSDIRSGLLVSTRMKDAICDAVRSKTGHKPVPAPKGQRWDTICDEANASLADPMCGSGTFLIEAALMAK